MLRFFSSASARHFAGDRERIAVVAHPTAGDRDAAVDVGVDVGQRTVGVVAREVAAPHLLEEGDGALRAHLLEADRRRPFVGVGLGVAEHHRRRRDDLEVVGRAAVAGEPSLHVGVELPSVVEGRVTAEDDVGVLGRQLAPAVGVAGLDLHRDSPAGSAAR